MKIRNKKSKKNIIIAAAAVFIIAISAGSYFMFQKNTSSPSKITTANGKIITSDPNVPKADSESGKNSGNSIPTDKEPTNAAGPIISSSTIPNSPTGNFVSNHRPNLSGNPTPNTETSVCTTTPGVMCKITFTNNDLKRELPAHTVDSSGSTQWEWTLQDIGLTEGTWTITATATNGSHVINVNDSMKLTVRT